MVQKYRGTHTHRRAILHMIGQSQDVFKSKASIADIAAWMNVTKPTAKKYLDGFVEREELIMSKVAWRKSNGEVTAWKYEYSLQPATWDKYKMGIYKSWYNIYVQRVLQVILT